MDAFKLKSIAWAAAMAAIVPGTASAVEFKSSDGAVNVTWTTDISVGGGVRLHNPNCSLIGDPTFVPSCGGNVNTGQWANGDDGDLNYKKGRLISSYLGIGSEVVLSLPESGMKFMARGSALLDPGANNTERTPLSSAAKSQIVHNARVLDLWGEKSFATGEGYTRVRLGNQVINWGEAQFLPYGINQTNAMDYMTAVIPGAPLKNVILPAPMVSLLTDLRSDLSLEAYYQFRWNKNMFAPVGSYWSASDSMGRAGPYRQSTTSSLNSNLSGLDAAALARLNGMNPMIPAVYQQAQQDVLANDKYVDQSYGSYVYEFDHEVRRSKQYGVRLSWRPTGSDAKFGFYYMRYTDKTPVYTYRESTNAYELRYLQKRDLFGVSANMPAGDWLIGGELAYRPRDAVGLTGCFASPNKPTDFNVNAASGYEACPYYRDNKRYQVTVNGQINLTPSNFSPIGWLKADTGYFLVETAGIYYPGLQSAGTPYNRTFNNTNVTQYIYGGGSWLAPDSSGTLITQPKGTRGSLGVALYSSLSYDGSIVPGWVVTPSIYYQQGVYGYSPGATNALWMQGVKAATLSLSFSKNPGNLTAGINLVNYWGGATADNYYADRAMLGFYATYKF
jgi:hypothetical protein